MAFWLMKSEPDVFGVADLSQRPRRTEHWDGVRNYQARNFLRAMRKGDLAFFYHSSCAQPGVYGIVRITRAAYPDPSALDPRSAYYDPKSTPDSPRWFMVDVRLESLLRRPVLLAQMKRVPALRHMQLLRPGSRLSVMPVSAAEWKTILALAAQRSS